MPTKKQIIYAMLLLNEAGFSTEYMNSGFKELGATMNERSGKVEPWLSNMSFGTISALIDRLKGIVESKETAQAPIAGRDVDRERAHRLAKSTDREKENHEKYGGPAIDV